MKHKGFTLIEVMIVISIATIFAAIILPRLPEVTAIIILKCILFCMLGVGIGSIACIIHRRIKAEMWLRRQLETPGEYMDRRAKKTTKQKASKLSKDLLQYVLKQIKHVWDSIIDTFFRETPPPKQGVDL